MKIAELINRLQEIRLDHGEIDVFVGLSRREVDEHKVESVSYARADEEQGLERRAVVMLEWSRQ